MKTSTVLLASAGAVSAQSLTADINAISSAVVSLNSAVSGFSQAAQASAIVDQSGNIVSLINKAASDAKSEGSISIDEAPALLTPFQNLQSAVADVVDNLVSRKAIATSNSLGNVVEAQLASQLTAAQAFASAVQAQLPSALASLGSSLAGAILSDLSSGSAAFSGLSGPSTLGGAPASGSASTTASSSASSSASGSASSSAASSSSSVISTPTGTGSGVSTPSSNVTVPTGTPSTTVVPGSGAEKVVISFFGIVAAAFVGMVAL